MNTMTESSTQARYHSVLAMEAARRMRRTREKQRTGKLVCHHLRRMLEGNDANYVKRVSEQDGSQYRLGI